MFCLSSTTARSAVNDPPDAQSPEPAPSASPSPSPTEWQANYHSAGNRPGANLGTLMREGPTGGIWQRSQLLGDPFGIRSWLGQFGLSLNIQETSEYLGNVSGGTRTGFDYDGLTFLSLQLDTQRAFGLRNGLLNASALDVHGLDLERPQSADAANREWHRGRRRNSSLGALVSAGVCLSTARPQTRRAEPGPGVHGEPVRGAFRRTRCSAGRC